MDWIYSKNTISCIDNLDIKLMINNNFDVSIRFRQKDHINHLKRQHNHMEKEKEDDDSDGIMISKIDKELMKKFNNLAFQKYGPKLNVIYYFVSGGYNIDIDLIDEETDIKISESLRKKL